MSADNYSIENDTLPQWCNLAYAHIKQETSEYVVTYLVAPKCVLIKYKKFLKCLLQDEDGFQKISSRHECTGTLYHRSCKK